jgi:hypothetical protein
VATLEQLLRDHRELLRNERPQSSWSGGLTPHCDAPDARSIVARNHDFETWDQFAAFREALRDSNAPVARFEEAVAR